MKVKKYQEPDGPIEQIVPVVPLANLSRSQIKQNAIGNARDEDFANDYLSSRISVDGNRRWQKRYHDRHFNRERKRIAREKERSETERQVAEMMSNNDWFYRSIGGGKPEHPASVHGRQYVQPLVNAAVWGIGGAMGAANPITTTVAPELLQGVGHVGKVMMNPASAETMAGAAAATAVDAAGMTYGLHHNSQLIDKWWGGNYDWGDGTQFALNTLGIIPAVNAVTKGINYFTDVFNTMGRTRNIVRPMTHGDPGLPQTYINVIDESLPRVAPEEISLSEVPASAFVPKPTPLDEVRAVINPSAAQTKFVDDVTRGALITRTTRPQTADPSALIDFTDEIEDIIAMGKMPDWQSDSYFKLYGLPGRKFLGEGLENAVFTNTGDDVLKFSLGRDIERISNTGDRFNIRELAYTSLEDMIAGASARLADANKYWFAEPTSLVGYYNSIGPNGQLLYYPVYSQTAMGKGLPEISIYDHISPDVMPIPFGEWLKFGNGQVRRTHGAFGRARARARAALAKDHPQFGYLTDGLYQNNIFLENDLPIPNDNHAGNFMYGKDGILRGIDLLKDGGTL